MGVLAGIAVPIKATVPTDTRVAPLACTHTAVYPDAGLTG